MRATREKAEKIFICKTIAGLGKEAHDEASIEDDGFRSPYKLGKNDYGIPEFKEISEYAYFDYQRERIYDSSEKRVTGMVKTREKIAGGVK